MSVNRPVPDVVAKTAIVESARVRATTIAPGIAAWAESTTTPLTSNCCATPAAGCTSRTKMAAVRAAPCRRSERMMG